MVDSVDLASLEKAVFQSPSPEAFLKLASAYLEQSRFMEAMVVCKKWMRHDAEDARARITLAKVYSAQNKYSKAIKELETCLQIEEDAPDVHFLLGELFEKSSQEEKAVEAFKNALRFDRHFEPAKQKIAERGLDFVPEASPKELEAQRLEAERLLEEEKIAAEKAEVERLHQIQERKKESRRMQLEEVELAIGENQDSVPPYLRAGSGAYLAATYAGGVPGQKKGLGYGFTFGLAVLALTIVVGTFFYMRSSKKEEQEIAALWKKSSQLMMADNTPALVRSIEYMEKILHIDEDHKQSMSRLSWLYNILAYERGFSSYTDKAKDTLLKAFAIDDTRPLTLATQMLQQSFNGKAAEALEQSAKNEAANKILLKNEHYLIAKGYALAFAGEFVKLKAFLKKNVRERRSAYLAFSGRAYRWLGDIEESRTALNSVLKLSPEHDAARAQRALLILGNKDRGGVDLALSDVRFLIDAGKNGRGILQGQYAILARAAASMIVSMDKKANLDFNELKKVLSRDPEYLLIHSRWLWKKSKKKEALKELADAALRKPVRMLILKEYLERSVKYKEHFSKALGLAEKNFPTKVDWKIIQLKRLEQKKDLKEAQKKAESWLLATQDPLIYEELGVIFLRLKEPGKALEQLKLADSHGKDLLKKQRISIKVRLGIALSQNEEIEKAIEIFKEVIALDAYATKAYFHLGRNFLSLDEESPLAQKMDVNALAKAAFKKVIAINSNAAMTRKAKKYLKEIE